MREWGEGERKKCKILNTRATVTVHICMVTVALVHKCTSLHSLMWLFFGSKYLKWSVFTIMQDFASTDVDDLKFWKIYNL